MPSWRTARTISALGGLLLSSELLLLAWHIWRVPKNLMPLWKPPYATRGIPWLENIIGMPPGLAPYLRETWCAWILIVLSLILTTLASTNIVAGMWLQTFRAQVDVIDCISSAAPPECIRSLGNVAAVGMPLMYIFAITIIPWIALKISSAGEYLAASTAAQRLKINNQQPMVLFLRSFVDDQVTIPGQTWTPMRFALTTLKSKQNLDRLLLTEFLPWAAPRALGKPEEKNNGEFPPFGALRQYADDDQPGTPTDQSAWRQMVANFSKNSRLIVLVFDERIETGGEGIIWELKYLGQHPELLAKTILLLHPRLGRQRHDKSFYLRLWTCVGRLAHFDPPQSEELIISFCPSSSLAIVGQHFSVTEYLLALRATIQSLAYQDEVSPPCTVRV